MNLYTSKQTKILERLAIKEQRFTAFSLMQEAANFSFNTLLSYWPDTKQVFTFCGKGNNAGDGLVMARHLALRGYQTIVLLFSNPFDLRFSNLLMSIIDSISINSSLLYET